VNKIAILCSGGDAPGMNPCLRAVTRTALQRGVEVWGVWDGYGGIVDHRMEKLTSRGVSGILQRGGSIIGSGRSIPFMEPAVQQECVDYLRGEGVEGLVVMGGDGSMLGAKALHHLGMPTVVVPATIDNDVRGTEITVGSDTAINTAVEAIDRLRDTASAHQRAMIVEVMGRNSGYIAIMAGLATGAEMIITPERNHELTEVFAEMQAMGERGKRHFILVLAEGAQWNADELTDLINDAPNPYDARYTVLGYIQRGGVPSRFDRILATRMGVAATEALLDGQSKVLVGWRNNDTVVQDIDLLAPVPDPWSRALWHVHQVTST
jgi:6-phosphofructokinase 1